MSIGKAIFIIGISLILLVSWGVPTLMMKLNPGDKAWNGFYLLTAIATISWCESIGKLIDKLK